ncbi:MAG: lipid-A-disaccharide synthase [Planctomycetota bacterium]
MGEQERELRVFLSAGEASGDLHASNLLRALRRLAPESRFAALGGGRLEAAGARLLHDMLGSFAVMGFSDALRILPAIRRLRNEVLDFLDDWRPHAAVLVDYPGFNVHLARHLKARGIPVFYYICPQVWAWARWRTRKIRRRIDKALVVFAFEEGFYRDHGIEATFVGHPLGDVFESRGLDREYIEKGPLSGAPYLVALVPGSRSREIEKGFPVKLEVAAKIKKVRPDAVFAVPVLNEGHARIVTELASGVDFDLHVEVARTYEVMHRADFALTTSGTAALELAHFGTPMVVLYRTNPAGLVLKALLLSTPYVSLVNIIAGRIVVPEFVYWRNRKDRIADAALEMITDPERCEEVKQGLAEVASEINRPGASENAARLILNALGRA